METKHENKKDGSQQSTSFTWRYPAFKVQHIQPPHLHPQNPHLSPPPPPPPQKKKENHRTFHQLPKPKLAGFGTNFSHHGTSELSESVPLSNGLKLPLCVLLPGTTVRAAPGSTPLPDMTFSEVENNGASSESWQGSVDFESSNHSLRRLSA